MSDKARFPGFPLGYGHDIGVEAMLRIVWPPRGNPLEYGASAENTARAESAATALAAYAEKTGGMTESTGTLLRDLLADLMHLNDCIGLPWTRQMQLARETYRVESAGEVSR